MPAPGAQRRSTPTGALIHSHRGVRPTTAYSAYCIVLTSPATWAPWNFARASSLALGVREPSAAATVAAP
ncbi:hypothetical protein D3C80_1527270 [compost metagenome]